MRLFQAAASPINLRVRVYLSAAVTGISRSQHLKTLAISQTLLPCPVKCNTSMNESDVAMETSKSDHVDRRRRRGRAHHSRGVCGPIGLIGGVVGGLFRR